MKLVLWVGGPEVVALENPPNYFECLSISPSDQKVLIDTIMEEIPIDAQIIIPLEVDDEEA